MTSDLARHMCRLAALALVASALTGCGRKGSLEPPPKADVNKTRASQAANADTNIASPSNDTTGQEAPPAAPTPTGGLTGFKAKKPPPIKPPKQPFFLDPLLQ